MVNRDERIRHRLGRLAGGDDVDELTGAGHVNGIGGHDLAPDRPQMAVQRLHEE